MFGWGMFIALLFNSTNKNWNQPKKKKKKKINMLSLNSFFWEVYLLGQWFSKCDAQIIRNLLEVQIFDTIPTESDPEGGTHRSEAEKALLMILAH